MTRNNLILQSLVVALSSIAPLLSFSVEQGQQLTPAERKALHEKRVMETLGGYVSAKGTPSGSIVVVNSQKSVSAENFNYTEYKASSWMKGLVKVVEGKPATVSTAAQMRQEQKADFAIFIVEDAALPPSLIAIEQKWAIVNVAALRTGGANDELTRIRARNEFSRVFTIICGGFCSQYQAPLMNFVVDVPDLDRCLAEPPGDMTARMRGYLERCGVKPERKVPYKRAVEEGWAPAPTNEFQKAVWDKVHAMPTEPLKIKPETKKVKE